MNSEELELSLRSEFESYLKDLVAEIKGDVADFQKKIEAELDSQKAKIDEAFEGFSARFASEHKFDPAFTESVLEHLRLARDEGAKITASAIADAEELERSQRPEISFSSLKDAINDISRQDSQATILKSLIDHAAEYTPRGAFFIIKSDNFTGWKVFGKEADEDASPIRDIVFPTANDTIVGKAVASLDTVEGSFGSYADDSTFLDALSFGRPDRMYAIPLVARGRGVAVLYADYGSEGVNINLDALETLVKIAGLTVELLASAKAHPAADEAAADSYSATEPAAVEEDTPETETETESTYEPEIVHDDTPHYAEPAETTDFTFTESEPTPEFPSFETKTSEETENENDYGFRSPFEHREPEAAAEPEQTYDAEVTGSFDQSSYGDLTSEFHAPAEQVEEVSSEFVSEYSEPEAEPEPQNEYSFESFSSDRNESEPEEPSNVSFDHSPTSDYSSFDPNSIPETHVDEIPQPETSFEPAAAEEREQFDAPPFDQASSSDASVMEAPTPAETAAFDAPPFERNDAEPAPAETPQFQPTPRVRLSDRRIDLPVEVSEDERRPHNDARRFARLLVSEIKLYNEKKVQEGRESRDLYDRLKEAIDRSREMYDKRVQPPVAAKFDYFHYELVNSLADGEEAKLGPSYSGVKV